MSKLLNLIILFETNFELFQQFSDCYPHMGTLICAGYQNQIPCVGKTGGVDDKRRGLPYNEPRNMPAIVLAYDEPRGGRGTRCEMLLNAQITAHSGHGRRQTGSEEEVKRQQRRQLPQLWR